MSDQQQTKDDEWKEIWDARAAALKSVLGQPAEKVYHSVIPMFLGGFADVMSFPSYIAGATYVTAEMTGNDMGQQPSSVGNYELMICMRQDSSKAADLISRLARYTCEAEVEPGQTMDIQTFFGDATMRALLFAQPQEEPLEFAFLGQKYGLLLCIGITSDELSFGHSHGTDQLLALLKQHGVFPYTVPDRPSVPLPTKGSFLGRLFGR